SFYQSLGKLYTEFNRLLDIQKLGYPGRLKKKTAQIANLSSQQGFTYWIGFYAIAPIEQKIIDHFLMESKGYVYWDAHSSYVDNKKNLAGDYFRKAITRNKKKYNWVNNQVIEARNIQTHAVGGNVFQSSIADDLLQSLGPDDTALILADEELLIPTLENLSSQNDGFNVSIQIPLDKSPFIRLVSSLIELHEKIQENEKGQFYYHKPLFQLLNNPIVHYQEEEQNQLKTDRSYFTLIEIYELLEKHELNGLRKIFQPCENKVSHLLERIEALMDYCRYRLNKDQRDPFYLEMLIQSGLFLRKLFNYCRTYPLIENFTILKRVINHLSREQKLDFYGEPLKGLQVIGLLESRALDFKNIILLGCNEGILPNTSLRPSFIPFDLRIDFGLPTQKEYESIYAYYFYRLFQHAENVHLVYNSKASAIGTSEKSRFISQLEFEHEFGRFKSPLIPHVHSTSHSSQLLPGTSISKDNFSRELIQKNFLPKISVSAFNNYLDCPIDFYYKRLLKLAIPEEHQEQLQNNTFGNIVHGILENLYKKFENGPALNSDILRDLNKEIIPEYERFIRIEGLEKTMQSALNQLVKEAIFEAVRKQIRKDIAVSEKHSLEIIALEENIEVQLKLGKYAVGLKGKIDRIDRLNGVVRIIDYKTGKVEPAELKISVIEKEQLRKKPKLIQLLFYYLLYYEHTKGKHSQPAMFSTMNAQRDAVVARIADKDINIEAMHQFREFLEEIIDEMMEGSAFTHDPNAHYCSFCIEANAKA
ncbi:MAG: PD-(D/E)XK nuclease family protein, partial [Bacteroidota bacterium]